jgi:cytochrome d ubiquinol oxidase subunit II
MSHEVMAHLVAATMLLSMIVYLLTGGADYGGGIWDLFATGERKDQQREALTEAIAPIWEANHVWLIVVVVLLFVGFPKPFAVISTALHIPITLMLIGLVLRGSAFAFRSYSAGADRIQKNSGRVFAISSVATPVMLGVVAGAVASSEIRINPETGRVVTDFVSAWLAPFPFVIGGFTLGICAYLAAVYMTVEVNDEGLREDFRLRALISGLFVGVMAFLAAFLSKSSAPEIWNTIVDSNAAIVFQSVTAVAALGALIALYRWSFRLARLLAGAQVAMILVGWALAQYPYIVYPDLEIVETAASASVLGPVLVALALGMVILVPSFWYLYAVFKGQPDVKAAQHGE